MNFVNPPVEREFIFLVAPKCRLSQQKSLKILKWRSWLRMFRINVFGSLISTSKFAIFWWWCESFNHFFVGTSQQKNMQFPGPFLLLCFFWKNTSSSSFFTCGEGFRRTSTYLIHLSPKGSKLGPCLISSVHWTSIKAKSLAFQRMKRNRHGVFRKMIPWAGEPF